MRRIVQRATRLQTLREQRNLLTLTVVSGGLLGFWMLLAHLEDKLF